MNPNMKTKAVPLIYQEGMGTGINLWHQIYNQFKDPTWPDCYNEHHFRSLPEHIKEEIINVHLRSDARFLRLREQNFFRRNDIKFLLDNHTDSPLVGNIYKHFLSDDAWLYYNDQSRRLYDFIDYMPMILEYFWPNRIFDHCLDWCAGSGYNGFRLLSDGVCRNLTLLEQFLPSIELCKLTIADLPNRFDNKCKTIQANTVNVLEESCKFDLIVANPPPVDSWRVFDVVVDPIVIDEITSRYHVNLDYETHHHFFSNISTYMTDDGIILLEQFGCTPKDFESSIKAGGLDIVDIFKIRGYWPWFMILTKSIANSK